MFQAFRSRPAKIRSKSLDHLVVSQLGAIDRDALASMSDDALTTEVTALLRRVVPRDIAEFNSSSSLAEDIGIDSLGGYELMIAAEDRFCIEIADKQLMELVTEGDTVALVKQKLGQ